METETENAAGPSAPALGSPRPPKRRADWVGQWVRLRTELKNGSTVIPAGMLCRVEYGHRLAQLTSEPCKCCGVAIRITRVEWHYLEYVGANNKTCNGGNAGQ